MSADLEDYENAVARIAIAMARERGRGDRQFYRYKPDEIMKLITILRANGELWEDGWSPHSAIRHERPSIRTGYVIRRADTMEPVSRAQLSD